MKNLAMLTAVATLVSAQPALAQVTPPALGITSPLGIGPGAPVGPVGVPLGATQLSTPGLSAALPGMVPQSAITGGNSVCGGASTMTMGGSNPTAPFDGGGVAGTASGTCSTGGSGSSNVAASASSPTGMGSVAAVGRVGIPMGSAELSPGGLSPLPPTTSMTTTLTPALTPLLTPSPLATTPPSMGSAMSPSTGTSTSSFAPTAPVTGRGVPCAGMPGNVSPTAVPAQPYTGAASC